MKFLAFCEICLKLWEWFDIKIWVIRKRKGEEYGVIFYHSTYYYHQNNLGGTYEWDFGQIDWGCLRLTCHILGHNPEGFYSLLILVLFHVYIRMVDIDSFVISRVSSVRILQHTYNLFCSMFMFDGFRSLVVVLFKKQISLVGWFVDFLSPCSS